MYLLCAILTTNTISPAFQTATEKEKISTQINETPFLEET